MLRIGPVFGYDRLKLMDKASYRDFLVEIIRRNKQQQGFKILPLRWVVEWTFGWMMSVGV